MKTNGQENILKGELWMDFEEKAFFQKVLV